MKAVFGASAGVGKALSYALAEEGYNLLLVARDKNAMEAIRSDICAKYPVDVEIVEWDFNSQTAIEFLNYIDTKAFNLTGLFYIAGFFSDSDKGLISVQEAERLMKVNSYFPIQLINAFLAKWDKTDNLNILGIGSVATIRARSSSIIYGSSKTALMYYFQGLMHRFFYNDKIFIQFYNLGYVDTDMTRGKKLFLPKVKPDYVAKEIVLNLNKKSRVAFIPFWWIVVSVILNIVPWFLYKRIKFKS